MRMVTCGECKKRYDFDQDDFCPRCGAFNPPQKQWTVDYYGNVVRVDGINERNHTGSFVHKEVHREKAVRRLKGLDYNKDHDSFKTVSRLRRNARSGAGTASEVFGALREQKKTFGLWIGAILAAIGFLVELLFG